MPFVRVVARSAPLRCARCLGDLEAVPWSCPACATALHDDCRREADLCPTLGCPTRRAAPALARCPARTDWLLRALEGLFLFGTPIGLWGGLAFVVPAFDRMFREVGVNLPRSTELVVLASRWACSPLALVALVALLALLRRAARTRAWLPEAVVLAGVAVTGSIVEALLPPMEILAKL